MLPVVKENMVPVGINRRLESDWNDGAGGKFLKALGGPWGGWKMATASGKVLASGNGEHQKIVEGLKAWKALPESERKPGAVKVEAEIDGGAKSPTLPTGGLNVRIYMRALKRDKGDLVLLTEADCTAARKRVTKMLPVTDNLWLTEAECKSLMPASPKKGDMFRVPDAIQKRIYRFHLIDGQLSTPRPWALEEIRSGEMTLTVEETSPVVRLRLQGTVLIETSPALLVNELYKTRFNPSFNGILEYDPAKKVFTRFDVVAAGPIKAAYITDDPTGNFPSLPAIAEYKGYAFELVNSNSGGHGRPGGLYKSDTLARYFAAEKK